MTSVESPKVLGHSTGPTSSRSNGGRESGAPFVSPVVGSGPRLPFGGINRSGCDHELAADGISEFVNSLLLGRPPGGQLGTAPA